MNMAVYLLAGIQDIKMPSFEKLFIEAKSSVVEYNGMKLYLADKFPVQDGDILLCSIERTKSDRRQGFSIDITGYCEMYGKVFKQGKGIRMLFWEDATPKKFKLKVFTKKDFVWIQNICEWEVPNSTSELKDGSKKTIDYGHNGAAMLIEKIESGRRYKCSDTSSAGDYSLALRRGLLGIAPRPSNPRAKIFCAALRSLVAL